MIAFVVCVNYLDELSLTLPYNREHFEDVVVITDNACLDSVNEIGKRNNAAVIGTDAFYDHGASFNKWLPLDHMLLSLSLVKNDWFCVMDADVLWPKKAPLDLVKGCLYTPFRRMYPNVPSEVPPEELWSFYPIHRNVTEFAGYSQIFHSQDPVLKTCGNCGHVHYDLEVCSALECRCRHQSWFQTDWIHAGGADSIFQRRWMTHNKVRPSWDCLHLGEPGQNWFGRATPLRDGTVLPGSESRRQANHAIWAQRRREKDPSFRSERTARAY